MIRQIKRLLKYGLIPYYYIVNPVKFNLLINEYERTHEATKLYSYPLSFGVNISNICNQNCLCCNHDNAIMRDRNWLSSETIKEMSWLRFVKDIQLFAGNGDPLTNPNFPEIARMTRKIAPHSQIGTFTNGLALNGDNLDAVLESLDTIHISLNAACEETYDKIILGGDFKRSMKNLRELSERRPPNLKVELSMILMKSSQNDIIPMIDLIHKLDFQRLIICHLIIVTLDDQQFGEEESLKTDLDEETWAKYKKYAEERGIEFSFPTTIKPPENCYAPWLSAFITNDLVGDRIFVLCCSGIETNLYVSPKAYSDFKSAWNHPRIQQIRATVNDKPLPGNNICYLCKQLDRTDPEWHHKIRKLAEPLNGVFFAPNDLPKSFPKEMVK